MRGVSLPALYSAVRCSAHALSQSLTLPLVPSLPSLSHHPFTRRQNILNGNYKNMGAAVTYSNMPYWTQMFGSP